MYYEDHEDDRGANDEGYYYAYCPCCRRETEHDPCSGCCSCPRKNKNKLK